MQLALFTTRNVAAMEELTWVSGIHQLMHCIYDTTVYLALSYPTRQCLCCTLQDYGIDFDDHDHPVKPFQCVCGSAFCRGSDFKVQA